MPREDALLAGLRAQAHTVQPRTVALRRALHRRPELGLELPATRDAVLGALADLPLQVHLGQSVTSVVAVLDGDRPGPTVLLRGDMDALPLHEDTDLEFASEIPGAMHACGHDTHVAMLASAARVLADHRDEIAGRVLLMFQPGEEGFFGARVMLDEGLLDDLPPESTRGFAIHISSEYRSGEIHLRPGALCASADDVSITVRGKGGHAAAPHHARDPIPVAAEMITALQVAMTRSNDMFDPAVLTIGHLSAGTTTNIIPETALLEGTFRCMSDERRSAMPHLIRRVARGVASAHEVEAEVRFKPLYPTTINDAGVVGRVRDIAEGILGETEVHEMPAPQMGAEDWSYVLQRIQGAMVFLGGRPAGAEADGYPHNHSNVVVFDEDAMAVGMALYTAVAQRLDPDA